MRNDGVYLGYIAESIELIEEYLRDEDGDSERLFFADRRTQDAVLRRMETLYDAAGHLSDALKRRHPEIAWPQIAGFRNILAHAYATIELERVWRVVLVRLPELRGMVDEEIDGPLPPA